MPCITVLVSGVPVWWCHVLIKFVVVWDYRVHSPSPHLPAASLSSLDISCQSVPCPIVWIGDTFYFVAERLPRNHNGQPQVLRVASPTSHKMSHTSWTIKTIKLFPDSRKYNNPSLDCREGSVATGGNDSNADIELTVNTIYSFWTQNPITSVWLIQNCLVNQFIGCWLNLNIMSMVPSFPGPHNNLDPFLTIIIKPVRVHNVWQSSCSVFSLLTDATNKVWKWRVKKRVTTNKQRYLWSLESVSRSESGWDVMSR